MFVSLVHVFSMDTKITVEVFVDTKILVVPILFKKNKKFNKFKIYNKILEEKIIIIKKNSILKSWIRIYNKRWIGGEVLELWQIRIFSSPVTNRKKKTKTKLRNVYIPNEQTRRRWWRRYRTVLRVQDLPEREEWVKRGETIPA